MSLVSVVGQTGSHRPRQASRRLRSIAELVHSMSAVLASDRIARIAAATVAATAHTAAGCIVVGCTVAAAGPHIAVVACWGPDNRS